jgi:site-specific DNA recombinase
VKTGEFLTNEERVNRIKNFSTFAVEHKKKIRVVYYARVSTEHEAQLLALDNQLAWYENEISTHSNWVLVGNYVDRGITGTQANKRPHFLEMLEDAKAGKFDLIVTREVCRFARNLSQTMSIVEMLKTLFIEVYFASDGIWTFEPTSLVKLGIMATLAQEESRKISERVRAGQATSREKKVLYGNGNILGYNKNKEKGTYDINEEEADTVRRIYELYLQGMGCIKICRILEKEGRKCSSLKKKDGTIVGGKTNWEVSKVSRILNNTTYMGYISYGQSISTGYLTQKRVSVNNKTQHQLVKMDIPVIIDEEIWYKVKTLRESKSGNFNTEEAKITRGKKVARYLWSKKSVCACGSSLRRDEWRADKEGKKHYGFKCYKQIKKGSKKQREEAGLDVDDVCTVNSVPEWKFDMLAKKTLEQIWVERESAVEKAYEIFIDCYAEEKDLSQDNLDKIEKEITKLETKMGNFVTMRVEGELTKEQFLKYKEPIEKDLELLKEKQTQLLKSAIPQEVKDINKQLLKMKAFFSKLINFDTPILAEDIVDYFIKRVVVKSHQTFEIDVNFDGLELEDVKTLPESIMKQPLFDYEIDYNEAHAYVKSRKGMLRVTQWSNDMEVSVSILISKE